ncbi:3-isopropylmalate dehydratase small subunit [Marinithermus hydrothermalis]|uniref:3-isopropylmalate dehydratase n=1 Tax=Marinithermus hydrothermalis (strain DSM 14884 / JCM 11576 / T1) TaxID=869210 RepID=F2NQH0_MARHT|nr:3-isopropylmalate dehydratase small subunit [Marinithermus hydrothermalis]AEB11697.1 3-isopropylmalate dehydratase, small subunit [Marinithermus hydrothermalis DSM 14884]
MERIRQITGRAVPVPGDAIDTDRILPARFMKVVTFDGLGRHLFHDERFAPDGTPKPHPLNDPRYQGARILLVGSSFGSGSSREHAPQAIRRAGFQALIGESFAEIFFGNATAIGLVCVRLAPDALQTLVQTVQADPTTLVTIDLEARTVRYAGREAPLEIREAARRAFLEGRWDPLDELLEAEPSIEALDRRMPCPGRAGSY